MTCTKVLKFTSLYIAHKLFFIFPLYVLPSNSFIHTALSWLADESWSSPPQWSLGRCWHIWWHLGLRRPSSLVAGSPWGSQGEALCPCSAKNCSPCQTWTAASGWWVSVTNDWFPLMIQRAPMGFIRYLFSIVFVCMCHCFCGIVVKCKLSIVSFPESVVFQGQHPWQWDLNHRLLSASKWVCWGLYTQTEGGATSVTVIKSVWAVKSHKREYLQNCFANFKHIGLPRWSVPCVWPVTAGYGTWWTHLFPLPRAPSSGGEGHI